MATDDAEEQAGPGTMSDPRWSRPDRDVGRFPKYQEGCRFGDFGLVIGNTRTRKIPTRSCSPTQGGTRGTLEDPIRAPDARFDRVWRGSSAYERACEQFEGVDEPSQATDFK